MSSLGCRRRIGVLVLAGISVLVRFLATQNGLLDGTSTTAAPAIVTGDAAESVQFAVSRDEDGDWSWCVLHLETVAESDDRAPSQAAATEQIERLQDAAGNAGLVAVPESAVRLYEDRDGSWRWTVVCHDGRRVGSCSQPFDERDDAEAAVSFLEDRGPDADVIDIEGAAFAVTEHHEQWEWRLLDDDRPVATAADPFESEAAAREALDDVRTLIDQAPLLEIDDAVFDYTPLTRRGRGGWSTSTAPPLSKVRGPTRPAPPPTRRSPT